MHFKPLPFIKKRMRIVIGYKYYGKYTKNLRGFSICLFNLNI